MTHVTFASILLAKASHVAISIFKGSGNTFNMYIENDETEYL